MQSAHEGILKRCRGFAALLLALCATFVLASRPGGAGTSSTGTISRIDDLPDCVEYASVDAEPAPELDCESAEIAETNANLIEAFDVGKNADSLFLPVMIDGQKWWFLVDTGCGYTIIDFAVAIHVGLIDRPDMALSNDWHSARRPLEAYIGKTRIPVTCQAACFDISHLRHCYNAFPLCGILGMDFLRKHVIGIDMDAGKLSFFKSAPESSGRDLKLSRDAYDRPIMSVEIAKGRDIWFVVDTGCEGPFAGTIEASLFTDLVKQKHLTAVRGRVPRMKISGPRLCEQARLDVFKFGGFEHSGLEFHDDNANNYLGLCYLSRYVVTLDFQNDSLYLKEGKRFAETQRSINVASNVTISPRNALPANRHFPWHDPGRLR